MASPMDRVNYMAETAPWQAGGPFPPPDPKQAALQEIITSLYMNPGLAERYLKGAAALAQAKGQVDPDTGKPLIPQAELAAGADVHAMENNPQARPYLERYRMVSHAPNFLGLPTTGQLPSVKAVPPPQYPSPNYGYDFTGQPAGQDYSTMIAERDPRKQALMAAIVQSLFGPGTNTAQPGR